MATPQENFDKGVELRLSGNEAFKSKDFKQAIKNYYSALLYLKAVHGKKYTDDGKSYDMEFKAKSDEQLVMIYNNMCAVFAKQDRWDRVLYYASQAHEIDDKNTKSKFRMGQAHLRLQNTDKAKKLLEDVLRENPGDALVKQELSKVQSANKQMEEKEKLLYRTMMSKLAQGKQ